MAQQPVTASPRGTPEQQEARAVLARASIMVVGDTGIEPVTSSVSGKRAPAAPIARGGYRIRTGVNGFAGRCLTSRPTHHEMLGLGAPGSSERMTGLEPATLTLAR